MPGQTNTNIHEAISRAQFPHETPQIRLIRTLTPHKVHIDQPPCARAKAIFCRHADVKIVLMTGYPELVESIRALDIDIADILVKPFSPDVLQRLIREVLSAK